MRSRSIVKLLMILAVMSALAFGLSDVHSQQRRRRPSRRVTHPMRPQPVPTPTPLPEGSDATVVSSADDNGNTNRARRTPPVEPELEQTRRNLEQLSDKFNKLSDQMTELQKQQHADVIQERLTRAEQRAENLQEQLLVAKEKEADLQARLQDLDYQLQPDSISSRAALIGTLHPDEARDQIRRQLEGEKSRVRVQLDQVSQNRSRLETSLRNADAEVERLRARMNELTDETNTNGGSVRGTTPSPTPSPTPNAPPPSL